MNRWMLLLLLLLCCCADPKRDPRSWMTTNGKVKVLSTTAMIGDLVKKIGAEDVDSWVLIQGELDPHSYQLVKGDDEKIAFADILFYNGLGLEHGPSLQYALAQNPKAFALGDAIVKRSPERILKLKGRPDPHIWMDASLWASTIDDIVSFLSKQDPIHTEGYLQRGNVLKSQLLQAHAKMRAELQAIPDERRYLITSHDAFNYFARAYLATDAELAEGIWEGRFEAPEGLAPESQISVADIRHIINHVKKYRIHTLFAESNVSRDSIRKIVSAAREEGVNLSIAGESLYGDAMGTESYLEMIEHNVKVLTDYLGRGDESSK